MSNFGGGNNSFGGGNQNNNFGGGGGNQGHQGGGGGRGRGRGRGRGGNYQGGRGGRGGGGRGGRGGGQGPNTVFRPCGPYTTTGNCQHGANCQFAHIVTLHKSMEASSVIQSNNNRNYNNNNNYNDNSRKAAVSSVSIWEMNGTIMIFTGSQDGFWRMWNTAQGFSKQAETNMKGKVECLQVLQNTHLYCGYEAISKLLPDVPVGMVNVWNLQNAATQPMELQVEPQMMPYAHGQTVTAIAIGGGESSSAATAGGQAGSVVVTGSKDGSIRLWTLQGGTNFTLVRTLPGHSRQITGLLLIPGGSLLWSSSTDGSIRIWDLNQSVPEKACQYCITRDTPGTVPNSTGGNPQNNNNNNNNNQGSGIGHSNAVTSLLAFPSPAGTFVLSSSLDGTIKAWDASNGQCVASESHTEGVVTMALARGAPAQPAQGQPAPTDDQSGPQVLMIGLESGNIACRNLVQTQNTPAFALLFILSGKYSAGHSGAVKSIAAGPSATFYSGGSDGNLMVWQFTGPMQL